MPNVLGGSKMRRKIQYEKKNNALARLSPVGQKELRANLLAITATGSSLPNLSLGQVSGEKIHADNFLTLNQQGDSSGFENVEVT
jgi:hypothetical protein